MSQNVGGWANLRDSINRYGGMSIKLLLRSAGVFYLTLTSTLCAETTRYPIVLAHGILASDGLFSMKRIASALRQQGNQVFFAEVSAVGPVRLRAGQLAGRIDEVLEITNLGHVNVIAHSMGGLDSRYLISRLNFSGKVASLTTLATPHRGSPVADALFAEVNAGGYAVLAKLVDFLASLFNQATHLNESHIKDGLYDLTTEQAQTFNHDVVDSPTVYYQSYAASAIHADQPRGIHRLLRKNHATIAAVEGPNDGMVSVVSAQWGNFRGTVEADHFTVAGLGRKNVTPFGVEKFIRGVSSDLAERGY